MKRQRYKIRFPLTEPHALGQDEAFFILEEKGQTTEIRFHDYGELYKRPGLYEQLFYDRLKCNSPTKVADILYQAINESTCPFSELRVLDVGAGNGMMGQVLMNLGVARIVGLDILVEAYQAAERDRPGTYDAYYSVDLADIPKDTEDELKSWKFDCMTCVAALGFGDIPAEVFLSAFNLIENNGWIAFNIKETFLDSNDITGFSLLIRKMINNQFLDIYHIERYCHRISIDGRSLYYFAIVGRKTQDGTQMLLE
jgi:SAM-dependent methyltransferase